MTLRDWNSFQYGSTGWTNTGTASFTRTAGTGQSGYASMRCSSGAMALFELGITTVSELIVGFCFKGTDLGGTFFRLDVGAFIALEFAITGSNAIDVTRNASTVIGTTTNNVVADNVETYFEIRVLGSVTVGEVEIHLNGDPTPVLNLSGVHTGSATYDAIILRHTGFGTSDFSAFYYAEVDATPPNDFLGHIRFWVPTPTANGSNSQWLGSDGNSTDNYLLVDDPAITPDDDTTYITAASVNTTDLYQYENFPVTPLSIVAVCPLIRAKKSDAGSRAIAPVIRIGATDYEQTEHFLSTTYSNYKEAVLDDPSTATDWTEAGVNAMQLGPRVTT